MIHTVWLLLMFAGLAYAGQATLPPAMEAEGPIGNIADVPVGTAGYMSCWGLSADIARKFWVSKRFDLWKTRDWLNTMFVTRTEEGVVITMAPPCCRKIPSPELIPSFYLPVMSFTCEAEARSWLQKWLQRWLPWYP